MDQRNQLEAAYGGRPAVVADYAPLPGVPDEMLDAAGNVRPAWRVLIEAFDELGSHELNTRFERADDEWEHISRGLRQRAELLELLVSDIYGDNRLVSDGVLPPELIARNQEFLRPMVGIKPTSGHFLHFCAFELGRGPDGGWW